MKKLLGIGIILTVLITLIGGPVAASVTFNPGTGSWFVGKGDVQTAFGWNNTLLQTNASGVTFMYQTTATYEVITAWATGTPAAPISLHSHLETVTTTVGTSAAVNGDSRQTKGQKQFTGFNLSGFNAVTTAGEVPQVSGTVSYVTYTWTDRKGVTNETDQLPVDENGNLYMEGNNKAVLSVTLLDSTGGLYASFGGASVLVWPTTDTTTP